MKIKSLDALQNRLNLKDEKRRYAATIFMVCLAVSMFLWLIINFSNDIEAEIEFPLSYANVPDDKVLLESSDSLIFLRFEEKGSSLFQLTYLKQKDPIRISLNNITLRKIGAQYFGYVLTSHMVDYIARQQDISEYVSAIKPDTLYFIFEDKLTKEVPVIFDAPLNFGTQYRQYGAIQLLPAIVEISGPASQIETIDSIFISDFDESVLAETTEKEIRIELVGQEHSYITPPTIKVIVPVEEFTEAKLKVNIKAINNIGFEIKTFPEQAEVTCLVALKDFQKVNPDLFSVVADFAEVDIKSETKVKLQLVTSPDFVTVTGLIPGKTEFLVLKK